MDNNRFIRFLTRPTTIICLIVLAIVFGFTGGLYLWGAQRLENIVHQIKAAGEPLTLAEAEAMRPKVADEDNMALLILKHGEDIRQYIESSEFEQYEATIPILNREAASTLGEKLTDAQRDAARRFLDANRDAIAGLKQAAQLPAGRYPPKMDPCGFLIATEHLRPHRDAVRALALDALLAADQSRPDDAFKSLVNTLALDKAMETEPVLISGLVRVACQAEADRAIQNVLGLTTLPNTQLRQLQQRLAQLEQTSSWYWACVTERAVFYETWNRLPGSKSRRAVFSRTLILDRAEGMDLMTQLCKAAKMPFPDASKMLRDVDHRMENLPFYYPLTKVLMPALTRVFDMHFRSVGTSGAMRTALAAERFRLKYNRWPETLNELVPEFIDAVPLDPFDGKPLRYVKDETGISVYAIGEDLTDDGGPPLYNTSDTPQRDWGCRLLNPDQRGRPPTTQPTTKPENEP